MEKVKIANSGNPDKVLLVANGNSDRNDILSHLLDKVTSPIVYVGKDYTSKYVNKAWVDWFGTDTIKITTNSELLDLSKIEAGKLELHCAEFNLEDLVEETVQDIRHTTSRHTIIVESQFEGKMYGDKDRIGQVLTNLLNNAIKYSPDAERVEVFVRGNNRNVSIRVKDFGIGIDKKEHQKIFERFYRVEGKTEQTCPGFGIGLFIAGEIIHRHRGTIDVKSEKDRGTDFTINLTLNFRNENQQVNA